MPHLVPPERKPVSGLSIYWNIGGGGGGGCPFHNVLGSFSPLCPLFLCLSVWLVNILMSSCSTTHLGVHVQLCVGVLAAVRDRSETLRNMYIFTE